MPAVALVASGLISDSHYRQSTIRFFAPGFPPQILLPIVGANFSGWPRLLPVSYPGIVRRMRGAWIHHSRFCWFPVFSPHTGHTARRHKQRHLILCTEWGASLHANNCAALHTVRMVSIRALWFPFGNKKVPLGQTSEQRIHPPQSEQQDRVGSSARCSLVCLKETLPFYSHRSVVGALTGFPGPAYRVVQ